MRINPLLTGRAPPVDNAQALASLLGGHSPALALQQLYMGDNPLGDRAGRLLANSLCAAPVSSLSIARPHQATLSLPATPRSVSSAHGPLT